MPAEKKSREPIKVTDKRLFTTEGELRDEYRESIQPTERDPAAAPPPAEPAQPQERTAGEKKSREKKDRTAGDRIDNPGTPFALFLDSLIVNAYMSMGMIRNPYQPDTPVDLNTASQMIEIIDMLKEKTAGNLTDDEEDYLEAHLGDLKLAFVRRNKAI
ncbi:MAG TPA: DUF1844 domain-containing protein [Thermoanaerobaculia bacterium]|nr:DUF1844 domain-containing protein [Thermoanaerobaculia bacterium]